MLCAVYTSSKHETSGEGIAPHHPFFFYLNKLIMVEIVSASSLGASLFRPPK